MLIVALAPLVALLPLTAQASNHVVWSRSWSPPLALLSNFQKGSPSAAGFLALPYTMVTLAGQKVTASARFKTRWVDSKALIDGPNILQQGLSTDPAGFKLQIAHGPTPASHRGNCDIFGNTGHIHAFGPNIDVADGNWHTITCVKYPDTAHGTEVLVVVDGVLGTPKWSKTPIGNIVPVGPVRLGGRSALAASDSLDGWISAAGFSRG